MARVDIFTRQRYKHINLEAFNYCITKKGLRLPAWSIASTHVHYVVSNVDGKLSDTVNGFKWLILKQIMIVYKKMLRATSRGYCFTISATNTLKSADSDRRTYYLYV